MHVAVVGRAMRSTRNLRLGRLTIDGSHLAFEEATPLTFDAGRDDELHAGIAFEYREASAAREFARIRIVAEAPGAAPASHEAHIKDNPALNDSRRGFVSVPLVLRGQGAVRVRYLVEADYEEGAWSEKAPDHARSMRHEGEFVVRLT